VQIYVNVNCVYETGKLLFSNLNRLNMFLQLRLNIILISSKCEEHTQSEELRLIGQEIKSER